MVNSKKGNAPMRKSLEQALKWRSMKSKKSKRYFKKWCRGETGFPIVDAGMRQMNCTGYMHNRLRMITSTFLMKDLHLDWRDGERYFATRLVDYDPASNNGGWQWSAGTGTDSQPYFRIFNPWTQAKKFDKNCEYIKKWIPELKSVPNKDIFKWYEKYEDYVYPRSSSKRKKHKSFESSSSESSSDDSDSTTDGDNNTNDNKYVHYFEPIVDHKQAAKYTLDKVYKGIKE